MTQMLVAFHCETNAGYAITRLERVFLQVARTLVGADENIHFAYPSLGGGRSTALPAGVTQVVEFDSKASDRAHRRRITEYVRRHRIGIALGFDQPVRRPGYAALREGGIRTFVSYWGAPISDLHEGWRLALRRLDARLARSGPDHYIFESLAMQRTAVHGRGIAAERTSVTYLGVDPTVFRPRAACDAYAHDAFGIPRGRRIVYFSGHMEERKGVHVLIRAIVELVTQLGMDDVHLLLLGNRPGESERFAPLYRGTPAEGHITFGGYRQDVDQIIPGCYLGAIGSTGWDSFTMSSLEIAACGLPLIVSRLPGLSEAVDEGQTGFTFPAGDYRALAGRIAQLVRDPALRAAMGMAARARVEERFTVERQVASLVATIRQVDRDCTLVAR